MIFFRFVLTHQSGRYTKLQKSPRKAIALRGSFLFCRRGSIKFCPSGSTPLALGGQTRAAFPSLFSSLLFLCKTLQSIKLSRFNILHLEHHSKVSTGHHRLSIITKHRPKISQLPEVVFCRLNSLYIFRYEWIVHKPLFIGCCKDTTNI